MKLKKSIIILFFICCFAITGFTQDAGTEEVQVKKKEKKPLKLNIGEVFLNSPKERVLGRTDLLGSYFYTKKLDRDIVIESAQQFDNGKTLYGIHDRMYISRGSKDGLKKGDLYFILSEKKDKNGAFRDVKGQSYYRQTGVAVILQAYENKSIIEIKESFAVVSIGDILVPYTEPKEVFKKKIKYSDIILPEERVEGAVVYLDSFDTDTRYVTGTYDYVSVALSKGQVKQGDSVLFYNVIRPDLPPMIIGTGVVVNAKETVSTVKIIETSEPVETGKTYAVYIQDLDVEEGENIPLINKGESSREKSLRTKESKSIKFDLIFSINSSKINEKDINIEKIREFIKDKKEYLIILKGYSCGIGKDAYNLKLSSARVEAVKAFLLKNSFDKKFIKSYFYGEKESAFDNSQEVQRRKNRRVALEVIGK